MLLLYNPTEKVQSSLQLKLLLPDLTQGIQFLLLENIIVFIGRV